MSPSIAIIGAGAAGLACAAQLARKGCVVRVFDKGRSLGGRCATRRDEGVAFDHGAQYVTATSDEFIAFLAQAEKAGNVAGWDAAHTLKAGQSVRYVGMPGMNKLFLPLTTGITVEQSTQVTSLMRTGAGWHLQTNMSAGPAGPFDAVVVTAPAAQTVELLGDLPLAREIRTDVYDACMTAMIAFETPLDAPDIIEPDSGPISWIARNSSKPGRDAPNDCWVVQARADWSAANLDENPEDIATALYAAFTGALGARLPPPVVLMGHRWRYALAARPLGIDFLWDGENKIGVAGDFCLGPRVELAFLSGHRLGNAMAEALG